MIALQLQFKEITVEDVPTKAPRGSGGGRNKKKKLTPQFSQLLPAFKVWGPPNDPDWQHRSGTLESCKDLHHPVDSDSCGHCGSNTQFDFDHCGAVSSAPDHRNHPSPGSEDVESAITNPSMQENRTKSLTPVNNPLPAGSNPTFPSINIH